MLTLKCVLCVCFKAETSKHDVCLHSPDRRDRVVCTFVSAGSTASDLSSCGELVIAFDLLCEVLTFHHNHLYRPFPTLFQLDLVHLPKFLLLARIPKCSVVHTIIAC